MTDDDPQAPATRSATPPGAGSLSPADEGLDRLLSGGGLSVQEEDAILGNVLDAVRAEEEALDAAHRARERADEGAPAEPAKSGPSWLERLRGWWALPPALAAAAAAFFLWPAPTTTTDDGFNTRGGGDAAAQTVLKLSCLLQAKAIDGCRPGATLVIGWRAPRSGFVTGAALGPDQALVWLFDGERVQSGASFAYQAKLPADLVAGEWQIVLLPSVDKNAPLTRDQARGRLEKLVEGKGGAEVVVATVTLTTSSPPGPEAGQP